MSDLFERLKNLPPERRAQLERLLMERQSAGQRGMTRRTGDGPWPVSFSQQLMWLADQLIPERSVYNVTVAVRLRGTLNVEALGRTLDEIVRRHESLRTVIEAAGGEPMQRPLPPGPVQLSVMDLSGVAAGDQEAEVKRIGVEQARRPFDLSRDMLLRAALLRLNPAEHVLLLMTHHITWDGWSRRTFFKEMEAIYPAFLEGKPSPLEEIPIQYADFAVWQRESMKGEGMSKALDYWKKTLAPPLPELQLPSDRPRPAVQTFRGARRATTSLSSKAQRLRELRAGEGTTMYMASLAAFYILLHRYTGQTDLVVGTPILGRNWPEVENMIGYFSNTLVLRADLSGDPAYRELLARVKDTVMGAFDHQEMPLDRLVMELAPERDASRSPLFQVLFGAGDTPLTPPALPGLEVEMMKIDRGIAKLDLVVGVTAGENQMMEGCEYSTDLFDGETVERMLSHLGTIFESVIENPDLPVSKLRMLPEDERRLVVEDFNRTGRDFDLEHAIPWHVERQAERTPDAVAVETESGNLTYAEWNARANQLAHYLARRGWGPGARIGICLERTPWLPVALLGVLKAGASAVPMDPAFPAERLAFQATESGAVAILASRETAPKLGAAGRLAIGLDEVEPELGAQTARNLDRQADPRAEAYVIFTSGSTGKPKGVSLSHRGMVNHHLAAIELYGITARDRVLQLCSISFDISIEEMWPVWMAGGRVVFPAPDQALAGREFAGYLESRGITMLDLPTAFWHEWVSDLTGRGLQTPAGLRLVIVGGEKAQASKLEEWQRLDRGEVRWINTYGPTEASIIATAYEPGRNGFPANLPIGKPIANVTTYVLDSHMQPMPVGIPGELYLGGEGVALGYLGDPALTAAKFVADPFSSKPGARLYRTGDRARWLAGGDLQFMGRTDDQVKIRGFRVEPSEVEAALAGHPGVSEAAVTVRQHPSGEKYLAGYVEPRSGVSLSEAQCRSYLRERLPDYMTPSSISVLERMPKTATGKVDRAALPEPKAEAAGQGEFAAPRTPVEEILAELWAEVLKRGPVGIHDDFFDLGGHSLLATRLMVRVSEALGVEMGLRRIFEAPTVAQFAELVFAQLSAEGAEV